MLLNETELKISFCTCFLFILLSDYNYFFVEHYRSFTEIELMSSTVLTVLLISSRLYESIVENSDDKTNFVLLWL